MELKKRIARKPLVDRNPDGPTGRVSIDRIDRSFDLLVADKLKSVRELDPATGTVRARVRIVQPVGQDPVEWAAATVHKFLGEKRLAGLTIDQTWAEIDRRAKQLRHMAWLNTRDEQAFLVAAHLVITHVGLRRGIESTIS